MVDPKKILMSLSKQQAAKNKPAGVDPKLVLFKMRKAARLRQATTDGDFIADPPFERRQV